MLCQDRNILRPLSQRRKLDREHIEPVKQVCAKSAIPHHLRQILIRGCYDANIHSNRAGAAKPLKLLFLQNSQELWLQFERQIADLIQKQCSLVGELKAARGLRQGSGEGSTLVAKQLVFEQSAWHRRAVHFDVWAAVSKALLVNSFGDKLLSRAGLALDQDCRIGSSHHL